MKRRYVDTIRLLVAWAPLTVEDIYRASRAFDEPFASMKRCREELHEMFRARLLGRAPIPDTGKGQKPLAYHLARGAAALAPEVAEIPKSNSVFHGLGKNPWHALATGEFWTRFEAGAAARGDIKILERVRDRQFVATLKGHGRLIPDGTALVEVKSRRKVLFLELVNETSIINPGAEATRARSLAGKFERYRAFRDVRKRHDTWMQLEHAHGEIGGFQVLVVTTRRNAAYLLTAAEGANTMFLFADLDELRSCTSVFDEPVWWLPRSAWRRGPERTALIQH
ncbi:MAG: hypothetical protein IT377_07320 [Polyangiaceae bacterium]|nr:hypothetical protein [Polyangiaceae bacterium]